MAKKTQPEVSPSRPLKQLVRTKTTTVNDRLQATVAKLLVLQGSLSKFDVEDLDAEDTDALKTLCDEIASDARMELWWIQTNLSTEALDQAAPTDDERRELDQAKAQTGGAR